MKFIILAIDQQNEPIHEGEHREIMNATLLEGRGWVETTP
jgi:hypothetical protein